jgi:hypothetical protein
MDSPFSSLPILINSASAYIIMAIPVTVNRYLLHLTLHLLQLHTFAECNIGISIRKAVIHLLFTPPLM